MKSSFNEFALHNWIAKLSFQMQALLLTGMRGPDNNSKFNSAKCIVRYLRGVVIKPAGGLKYFNGEDDDFSDFENDNDFMWGDYRQFHKYCDEFWNDHDEFPHHFIMHIVHCAQVVGYKHPNKRIRNKWIRFYNTACESFHMMPEMECEMCTRLNDFGNVDTDGCPLLALPF